MTLVAISLGGPPSDLDRVLFDGLDLFGGPLEEVVGQLRQLGYSVTQHSPNLYMIDDADVWLALERPTAGAVSSDSHTVELIVARPASLAN